MLRTYSSNTKRILSRIRTVHVQRKAITKPIPVRIQLAPNRKQACSHTEPIRSQRQTVLTADDLGPDSDSNSWLCFALLTTIVCVCVLLVYFCQFVRWGPCQPRTLLTGSWSKWTAAASLPNRRIPCPWRRCLRSVLKDVCCFFGFKGRQNQTDPF